MTEPKLLTEADMVRFNSTPWREIKAELRERGLIAEGQVDPVERVMRLIRNMADDSVIEQAIREIAQPKPELTRVMLGDAIVKVFHEGAKGFGGVTPDNVTRLHAALLERLQ